MRCALAVLAGLFFSLPGCPDVFGWHKNTENVAVYRALLRWSGFDAVSAKFDAHSPTAKLQAERYLAIRYLWQGLVGELRPASSAWLHNLGNAHFLADQLPEAILAYRQGLRLDPNDQGLHDNLDYARARVNYPFGTRGQPEEDSRFYQPSPFQVLVGSMVLYGLTCVLVTRWFMTRRRVLLIRASILLVLAAAGGFFWLQLESASTWRDQHPLVVVRDDRLPLRRGNGPSYPAHADLPFLSRGMEARQMHERGGWLQIQFASGEVGWVEKTAVLRGDE
jgi:hypothetical protein